MTSQSSKLEKPRAEQVLDLAIEQTQFRLDQEASLTDAQMPHRSRSDFRTEVEQGSKLAKELGKIAEGEFQLPNADGETILFRVSSTKIQGSFENLPGKEFTVDLKKPLSEESLKELRSILIQNIERYWSRSSDNQSSLVKDLRKARLQAALYSDNASPLVAAEELGDYLAQLIGKEKMLDWPKAKIEVQANAMTHEERFNSLTSGVNNLVHLTDRITGSDQQTMQKKLREIGSITEQRLGSQIIATLLTNDSIPAQTFDAESLVRNTEEAMASLVKPALLKITVQEDGYTHYRGSIAFERSENGKLKVEFRDETHSNADLPFSFTVGSVKDIFERFRYVSGVKGLGDPKQMRWDFKTIQTSNKPFNK